MVNPLVDTRVTLSSLNPLPLCNIFLRINMWVVGIANNVQAFPLFQSVTVILGPLNEKYFFLLCDTTSPI